MLLSADKVLQDWLIQDSDSLVTLVRPVYSSPVNASCYEQFQSYLLRNRRKKSLPAHIFHYFLPVCFVKTLEQRDPNFLQRGSNLVS